MHLISIIFLLLLSFNCAAAIWKINYSGQIGDITEYLGEISTETRGDYNFHEDRFFLGQSFSGSMLIDDSVSPGSSLADDPESDIYSALVSNEINIGSYGYEKTSTFPSSVIVRNRQGSGYKDIFYSGGITQMQPFTLGEGKNSSSSRIFLFDDDGDVFNSPDLVKAISVLGNSEDILGMFEHKSWSFLHMSTGDEVTNKYLFMDGDIKTFTVSKVSAPNILALIILFVFLLSIRGKTEEEFQSFFRA